MATATIAAAMGATRWPRRWACGASYGQGWRIFPMGGRRNALVGDRVVKVSSDPASCSAWRAVAKRRSDFLLG